MVVKEVDAIGELDSMDLGEEESKALEAIWESTTTTQGSDEEGSNDMSQDGVTAGAENAKADPSTDSTDSAEGSVQDFDVDSEVEKIMADLESNIAKSQEEGKETKDTVENLSKTELDEEQTKMVDDLNRQLNEATAREMKMSKGMEVLKAQYEELATELAQTKYSNAWDGAVVSTINSSPEFQTILASKMKADSWDATAKQAYVDSIAKLYESVSGMKIGGTSQGPGWEFSSASESPTTLGGMQLDGLDSLTV